MEQAMHLATCLERALESARCGSRHSPEERADWAQRLAPQRHAAPVRRVVEHAALVGGTHSGLGRSIARAPWQAEAAKEAGHLEALGVPRLCLQAAA